MTYIDTLLRAVVEAPGDDEAGIGQHLLEFGSGEMRPPLSAYMIRRVEIHGMICEYDRAAGVGQRRKNRPRIIHIFEHAEQAREIVSLEPVGGQPLFVEIDDERSIIPLPLVDRLIHAGLGDTLKRHRTAANIDDAQALRQQVGDEFGPSLPRGRHTAFLGEALMDSISRHRRHGTSPNAREERHQARDR